MTSRNEVKDRSYGCALRVVRLARLMSRDHVCASLSQQLLRAATSVGANVEEAQAAQSRRDFVHKMSTARKESREAHDWLRLFRDAEVVPAGEMMDLVEESDQLVRMFTSIVRTAQSKEQGV